MPGWLLAPPPFARAIVTGGLPISTARQGQTDSARPLQALTYRDGLQLMTRHHQPGTGPFADPAT